MKGVVINKNVEIGRNCIINTGAIIEHDAIIGSNCHVSTGAIVNGGSTIGNNCFIGSGSVINESVKIPDNQIIPSMTKVTKKYLFKNNKNAKTFIIAEAGVNHNGKIYLAKNIDKAKVSVRMRSSFKHFYQKNLQLK